MRIKMPQPRGLVNLGNTCYFNAILQLLAHCPAFVRFIDNTDHQSLLTSEVRTVLRQLWDDSSTHPVVPTLLVRTAGQCTQFDVYRENDAHELFCLLIDALCTKAATTTPDLGGASKLDADWKSAFASFGQRSDVGMAPIFHGQTISSITCSRCGKTTNPGSEVFSSLVLELGRSSASSSDLLSAHFQPETVHHWTCDSCGVDSVAIKHTALWRLPKVLVLCIKRFLHDGKSVSRLDVSPCKRLRIDATRPQSPAATSTANHRYRLVGVVCHVGSQYGGHYVTMARRPDGWFEYDDPNVRRIDGIAGIPSSTTYMLAYERVRIPTGAP
jgi:ubiquitin carboxyl-terminal hydrolase 22/27/51